MDTDRLNLNAVLVSVALLLLAVPIACAETLTGDEVGKRLNGRVVVRTMPRRPFPEYITVAECQTLDLVGGEVRNFCGSIEVDPEKPYAQVMLFKTVNGTKFSATNLDNVETKDWKSPAFVTVTQKRFKADPEKDNKDRLVKPDGTWDTKFIDGSAVAVEVGP